MNPQAEEYLKKILAKTPQTLTTEEIAFLRARKSYLKQHQIEEFSSILVTKPLETETVKSNAKNKTK